jgi:hypothetical protein
MDSPRTSPTENATQAARLAEFEHWTTTLAPGGELDLAK